MSTRSTTHFLGYRDVPEAIIYRHSDGYPTGAGEDILTFLDRVAKLADSRLSDPSYLAAKYVVFLAEMFAVTYDFVTDPETGKREFKSTPSEDRLEFISVGVVRTDPSDIEYRYVVDCNQLVHGRPTVTVIETRGLNYGGDLVLGELSEVVAKEAAPA